MQNATEPPTKKTKKTIYQRAGTNTITVLFSLPLFGQIQNVNKMASIHLELVFGAALL